MNIVTLPPKIQHNPVRALVNSSSFKLCMLLAFHPLLALAMRESTVIATIHAGFTIVLGIVLALFSKNIGRVALIASYIAGSEILWRMTRAQVFWESGKYFTILILILALLRIRHWQQAKLPVVYFLLLCLSIPLTLFGSSSSESARDAISFNLSGPLALSICVLYFSQITLESSSLRRVVWCLVMPILGIATLTLTGTLATEQIRFTAQSNFVTSGGFGPNQVSAILGLGGGLLLLLSLQGKGIISIGSTFMLGAGLLTLSTLTFSRGGLYNAALMVVIALVHYLRNLRGRTLALLSLLIGGVIGGFIIFPRLDTYTGGMLAQRFSDLDPAGRIELAQRELDIWIANPIFGVGPGLAKIVRLDLFGMTSSAHTEYTRLLAEHGIMGLFAFLMLLLISVRTYLRAPNLNAQTWVAALLAWPLMEMSHAAMRIVAISFLFGLSQTNWSDSDL